MLLSFAQFEREVTAERIRDKIAASKKRGLWMGGVPPLGYDAHPDVNIRSLVINEGERGTVETLYALYDDLGCLRAIEEEAARRDLCSKRHTFSTGRSQGGRQLSRGQIYHILCNPIYAGRIRHKDKVYDGQHPAVIDDALWERVQIKLQEASARPRSRHKHTGSRLTKNGTAPLVGKFRDPAGDRLTPSHTKKGHRRIRYYVSNRLLAGGADATGWRLSAPRFEEAVAVMIADHLDHLAKRHALLIIPDLGSADAILRRVGDLTGQLRNGDGQFLTALVREGQVQDGRLSVTLNADALAGMLEIAPERLSGPAVSLNASFTIRRRGVETRLVVGDVRPEPDHTLLRGLAKGHRWAVLLQGGTPISQIARRERVGESFIRTRIRLAYLAPRIQHRILNGTQPVDLTLEKLVRMKIPLDWQTQEHLLGITP